MALITLTGQHPNDELDHVVQFATWLDDDTDTIASVAVTVASGLTLGVGGKAPSASGTDVTFWLSGGTSGERYPVEVTAYSTNGRIKTVDAIIDILDPTP